MKKSMNQIYKKIIKQSKEKFYFEDFFVSNEVRAKIEIFQINLILVLWCLKKLKLPESNISFLISMFLNIPFISTFCFKFCFLSDPIEEISPEISLKTRLSDALDQSI